MDQNQILSKGENAEDALNKILRWNLQIQGDLLERGSGYSVITLAMIRI